MVAIGMKEVPLNGWRPTLTIKWFDIVAVGRRRVPTLSIGVLCLDRTLERPKSSFRRAGEADLARLPRKKRFTELTDAYDSIQLGRGSRKAYIVIVMI